MLYHRMALIGRYGKWNELGVCYPGFGVAKEGGGVGLSLSGQ